MNMTEKEKLLTTLENRFNSHMYRHEKVAWEDVLEIIAENDEILTALEKMEETAGEPDVIALEDSDLFAFIDCAKESPTARRSVCYDDEALQSRKKYKPDNSAIQMAEEMGVSLLSEKEYRLLQEVEAVDKKTSSWLQTPSEIRQLGGAIFGDRRYERVFVYHNGAESYYKVRGFRGIIHLNK